MRVVFRKVSRNIDLASSLATYIQVVKEREDRYRGSGKDRHAEPSESFARSMIVCGDKKRFVSGYGFSRIEKIACSGPALAAATRRLKARPDTRLLAGAARGERLVVALVLLGE